MSRCKIGDLVRYSLDDVQDEFGSYPSHSIFGIVVEIKKVIDVRNTHGQRSLITVFWSDGTSGFVTDDEPVVFELLSLTGSCFIHE
jgi:hypothetical protein